MPHEPTFQQAGWQARDVFNIVVSAAEFAREPRARRYLRLLAVLAAPVANARGDGPTEGRSLDVWGEWERLRQATDRARDVVNETGAPWAVVRLVPPTAESLRRALVPRDPGYQVLHLSCHGSPSGLTLEDTLGRERLLPTDDLVAILRTTTVRLVVLNACSTAELGQALVERASVPCVIATREPIDDREARLLSEQLYGDLAAGACVGEALQQTQNTIIEQMRAGDLRVPGTPEARANNLLLFGDSGLRLDPGDEAASAPCFILHPVPHNHPLPFEKVSGFVGRADELVELARWFEQTGRRAFLISGVGGIGKTALALNAALRHSYRFRALAFASAKDLPEFGPLQVLQALNEALSMTTAPDEAANLPGAIARRLNTNAVLLILDNLETLARERIVELAHALAGLDPHNGSRVLMTLRPLEHGPLTALADRRDRRDLATLGRVDALRLVWDEAGRQNLQLTPQSYGRPLTPDQATELAALREQAQLPAVRARVEVAALAELGELAFHHPALIKLAVAIVAEEGWDQARHAFQRLRGYGIEQALEEMIGRMLDTLLARVPDALGVLHAAMAFVGGAEERRLRTVAIGQTAEHDDAILDFRDQVLRPSERANLLTREGGRYDLEPSVRAYLERRRPPETTEWRRYCLSHAEAHLVVIADYDAAIREGRMTYSAPLEWSNVAAAVDRLAELMPTDDAAARVLVAYAQHWSTVLFNNYDPRRVAWLEAADAAAERVGSALERANVLQAMGDVQRFRKEMEAALVSYKQALTLYQAVGARLGEANVLQAMGDVQRFRKEMEAALVSYKQALTLYQAVGARLGEANVLLAMGDVQQFREEMEAALVSYQQALTLYQAVGERVGEANVLLAMGDVQRFREEMEAALVSYQQALTLYQAAGSRLGEANVLVAKGQLTLINADQAAADRLLEQALAIYRTIGDRYSVPAQIGNYGWTLWRIGRHEQARPYLLQAADLFAEMGLVDYAERYRSAAEGSAHADNGQEDQP